MWSIRSWENAKRAVKHFRRREPEKSALYSIVSQFREELPIIWEDNFQKQYGVLRTEVLKALDEYLNCGLLCHGAARAYCDRCEHSMLIAFSCKKRGICPSCSAKRAVIFAEHLYESVLEKVEHRHIVFSLPRRIRAFFRYDRNLNNILFNAAWGSIQEILCTTGTPASVLTLQTAGEALNFNPHLHGAIANGLFLSDGTFVPFQDINTAALTESFQTRVLAALDKLELIDDGTVEQILSQAYSGFSVWLGEPFIDSDSKKFVARYIERGPISLQKLSIQDDIVTYTTKDGKAHEFEPLEFLALLTSHLPNKYESITRYYGHYSCRVRGKRAKLNKAAITDLTGLPDPITSPSASWAACMKRVFEINPLECPRCMAEMRIISFLTDTREIKKIMDNIGIPGPEPPKKIPVYTHDDFDPQVDISYDDF